MRFNSIFTVKSIINVCVYMYYFDSLNLVWYLLPCNHRRVSLTEHWFNVLSHLKTKTYRSPLTDAKLLVRMTPFATSHLPSYSSNEFEYVENGFLNYRCTFLLMWTVLCILRVWYEQLYSNTYFISFSSWHFIDWISSKYTKRCGRVSAGWLLLGL